MFIPCKKNLQLSRKQYAGIYRIYFITYILLPQTNV